MSFTMQISGTHKMEYFKIKIEETLRELGKNGALQNEINIFNWCRDGEISYTEAEYLKRYNRGISKRL